MTLIENMECTDKIFFCFARCRISKIGWKSQCAQRVAYKDL